MVPRALVASLRAFGGGAGADAAECGEPRSLCTPQWGRTLLHVAATDNRLALARLLLDRGADPGAQCLVRPLHAP